MLPRAAAGAGFAAGVLFAFVATGLGFATAFWLTSVCFGTEAGFFCFAFLAAFLIVFLDALFATAFLDFLADFLAGFFATFFDVFAATFFPRFFGAAFFVFFFFFEELFLPVTTNSFIDQT